MPAVLKLYPEVINRLSAEALVDNGKASGRYALVKTLESQRGI